MVQDAQSTGRDAVVNVSLGGTPSDTLDDAVNTVSGNWPRTPDILNITFPQLALKYGIHVVV